MGKWLFALLLAAVVSQSRAAPVPAISDGPSVSISLPASVPSETVQIAYQLIGDFGGASTYTDQQPNAHSYFIDASLEGKAATEIKIVVYAAGCKIQTFDVLLSKTSNVTKDFVCDALPTVTLSGQVIPSELVRGKNTVLSITYMAEWVDDFFGIMDGAVFHFEIASLRPRADGTFEVEVPDFTTDTALPYSGKGTLSLMLLDSKTLNPVAGNLEPERSEFKSEEEGLKLLSYYPSGLRFRASQR